MTENLFDRIFKSFWIFGIEIAYVTLLINPLSWLFITYTQKIIDENKVN